MSKAFPQDLLSSSIGSLIILDNATIKPIEEGSNYLLKEEEEANENLLIGNNKIETITESEEESNSNEGSKRHSSRSSSKSKSNDAKMEHGRWTCKEHQLFLEGLIIYGNEWKMVQKNIQTRSCTQARSHAQKFFIKIRKNIMHETDKETIKKIIHEIFKKEMKNQFNPQNLSSFLDKMADLVFASDNGGKKLLPLIYNKFTSHESSNTPPSRLVNREKEKENEFEPMSPLDNDNQNLSNCVNKKKRKPSLKIPKEQYFKIEKDKDKCQLRLNNTYKQDSQVNQLFTKSNQKNYEDSTHTTHYTSPLGINLLMVDNSEKADEFNDNDNDNNNHHHHHHKKQLKRTSNTTNPFNLEFEEILNRSTSNSNYYGNKSSNDNIINMQDDEKQYYNDDHSFSSFEL